MKNPKTQDELIDHILNFDPEDSRTSLDSSSEHPALMAPRALPTIPWPKNSKPIPQPYAVTPDAKKALPEADVIIVTWTVAEALALSDVLTPGYRSKTDWYEYKCNWTTFFKPKVKKGAPALIENRLGLWFRTKLGNKNVICFKSELHMARDGSKFPLRDLWKQLINEVKPNIIITTGTAGGIGATIELGDVIATNQVRFDCNRTFKNAPFNNKIYTGKKPIPKGKIVWANAKLMGITTNWLPEANRHAKIVTKPSRGIKPIDIVTTDFFAFDEVSDHYKLQGLGAAVEMGDASLGLACSEIGTGSPTWIAVRNASDPQIDGNLTLKEKADKAARIYEKYGYWTTVNSAIACWALIV